MCLKGLKVERALAKEALKNYYNFQQKGLTK
jgi:hypothetical protein